MRISELSRLTGCHLETIRYYERIGLLAEPARSPAGYRSYTATDADRLSFIVRSRALGFHLDEVRSLVSLAAEQGESCAEVDRIARAHLAQVEKKQRELAALAAELGQLLDQCRKGTRAGCNILNALSTAGGTSHASRGAAERSASP
jgi:MerR family mercuric resistance operon transcriptional regulator